MLLTKSAVGDSGCYSLFESSHPHISFSSSITKRLWGYGISYALELIVYIENCPSKNFSHQIL